MRPDSLQQITVLIADDESPARRRLRALLEASPDVTVVGEVRTGQEAIAAILALRPSVVFLDVQMPDGGGFDVVRAIGPDRMPVVVFATAFDQYALEAFDAHAIDYLLKPFDRARFEHALTRACQQVARRGVDSRLFEYLSRLEDQARYLQRIVVRNGARTQFVPVASVDWFEAEANYVRVRAADRSWLIRETLSHLMTQLDPARFLRIHRSIIVHLPRIVEVESLFAGEFVLTLTTGRRLTSGRTYRAAIQSALGI